MLRLQSLLLLVPFVLRSQAINFEAVWDTITPSTNLSWVACYDTFQCARYQVPMDYTKPNGSTAAVALLRIPSALSPQDKNYRGPIVIIPGGPGGSSIDLVVQSGTFMQQIVGDEYDILGFDPRGVGRTTPNLSGFTSSELSTFAINALGNPLLGTTPDSIARTYARFASFGQVAEKRINDMAHYISTPFVARDLLAITKAHGFDKLTSYGVSYGTVISSTFATMFPNNVGRMMLDGVVDGDSYYSGKMGQNLGDADKGLEYFYEHCVQAGQLKCALYERTPEAVASRVAKIFDSFKRYPIPAVGGDGGPGDYGVIGYAQVRRLVFDFLYYPFQNGGQNLARILTALEKGDGSSFWAAQPIGANTQCDSNEKVEWNSNGYSRLTTQAIQCGDGKQVKDTVPQLEKWYEANKNQSSFADQWLSALMCAGWKVRPAESFKGPFGPTNTSSPLLFIGNTADPVTPLVNAKKMSKYYPGSVVLTVDTIGHTSHAASSMCANLAMRSYIRDGVLPKPGTVCAIESDLFADSNVAGAARRDDGGLVYGLSKKFNVPKLGGF